MPVVVILVDSWQFRGKIEQVIELVIWEGFHRTDNEFLVDVAFTFPHTVNLTYRYSHNCGQFRKVFVIAVAELKNSCFYNHSGAPFSTIGNIIATNMPFVKYFKFFLINSLGGSIVFRVD